MNRVIFSFVATLLIPLIALAVDPVQIDDFEDGTTQNWIQGATTGQPTNVPNGGPGGVGDNYLQTVSTGAGGAGSRMVTFNGAQWGGDYTPLGSEIEITMMVANLGASPLNIRIGVESPVPITKLGLGGGQHVSTNALAAPADGVWRQVTFTISDAEMTHVGGVDPLSDVLLNVTQFRILSSASPSWRGDSIAGTLGVDDISIGLFADGFESGDTSKWSSSEE